MLVDLAGARMTGHVDVHDGLPERPVVRFRPERASKLIGLDVPPDDQRATLTGFGFDVSDDWQVTVPTWRARDVTREVDLIEEVARPLLDRIPYTMPLRRHVRGRLTKEQRLRRVVEDTLVGAGLSEAYTWSLVASDPSPDAIRLPNPDELGAGDPADDDRAGPVEAARTGSTRERSTSRSSRSPASTSRRGAAARRALARRRDRDGRLRRDQGRGRDALLRARARAAGRARLARPPPSRARRPRPRRAGSASSIPSLLEGTWGVFELDLETLFADVPERIVYEDVITYPAVLQDIAVAVDEDVEVGALVDAAREAAGGLLREARVFDVYRGEQVGAGRKSVAIHLAFQSPERTLTEEEATTARERIVAALAERFWAELRS